MAKDKKWIQKAVNPAHKGYCTPMTKATCTPKRKALAVTLKKIGKGVLKSGGKVSKQLGSAKHTIGNMHFAKKKEIK